jgi:hypothetical protein
MPSRADATRAFGRAALPVLLALATPGCRDWRGHVDPARARAEPEQVPVQGEPPIELEARDHRIRLERRASYRITGYAVETSRKLLDRWDFVLPMDLALAWGPVADPRVLSHMKFHLSRRYVSWWADAGTPPEVVAQIPTHVANHHLIAADEAVARALDAIRVGDLVSLRGALVDMEIRDPQGRLVHAARTSLTRSDVGSGACEQLWVEAVEVERPE